MKINFDVLKEIETEYCNSIQLPGDILVNADISKTTLQTLIDLVLSYSSGDYSHAPENVRIAFNTLKSLGIISFEAEPQKSLLKS